MRHRVVPKGRLKTQTRVQPSLAGLSTLLVITQDCRPGLRSDVPTGLSAEFSRRHFSLCVRTGVRDLFTLSLVGAPCFSRGELDFSPAEKHFTSQMWALALDFRGQR
jgi:hypothetical protein